MTTLHNLLAAVREEPDDDVVPLVLADWLEENGDLPRAEFIRVQVQLEKLRRDPSLQAKLRHREKDLRRRYAGIWLGPFYEIPGVAVNFYRGMLKVSMTGKGFLNASREVPADAPEWDWVLRPTSGSQYAESVLVDLAHADVTPEFLTSPLLPHVNAIDGGDFGELASATTLTGLTHLFANGEGMTAEGVEPLLHAPFLRQLVVLDLGMSEHLAEEEDLLNALAEALRANNGVVSVDFDDRHGSDSWPR